MYNPIYLCTYCNHVCTNILFFVHLSAGSCTILFMFVHRHFGSIRARFISPGPQIPRLPLQNPTSHNRYYVNLFRLLSGFRRVKGWVETTLENPIFGLKCAKTSTSLLVKTVVIRFRMLFAGPFWRFMGAFCRCTIYIRSVRAAGDRRTNIILLVHIIFVLVQSSSVLYGLPTPLNSRPTTGSR